MRIYHHHSFFYFSVKCKIRVYFHCFVQKAFNSLTAEVVLAIYDTQHKSIDFFTNYFSGCSKNCQVKHGMKLVSEKLNAF